MLQKTRREQIVEYIRDVRSVTSEQLSKRFNVTEETIRKDLNFLNNEGFLIRTFGGAVIKEEYDPSIDRRAVNNLNEKRSIAKAAAALISESECIVLDAGSTIIELAREMCKKSENVVITNSLEILNILSKVHDMNVIGTGGILRSRSMSFQGSHAEHCIESYNIQKAFMSAKGISLDEGIMDTNEFEAGIKRKMIENAKTVILLADHSKFSRTAHITVCPADRIDIIVTDSKTDPDVIKSFQAKGIKVIIAGSGQG